MRGILGLFLVICLFFYPLDAFCQEEGQSDQLFKLAKDAVNYYQNGEMEASLLLLNQILIAQPSDKEALQLREIVSNELMMQMLMQGGEFSRVARALLLYAEKAPIRKETDIARIQKLVEIAATGNLYQKNDAIALLSSQVGELAIPSMLPYLADATKDTERINIILAIHRMGKSVVNPLIEALKTNNYFLKQQIAIVLGHIGDKKAIPDLKKIIEDPRADLELKKYAKTSLSQISKRPTIIMPSAKNLYYEKAMAYYKDDPTYKPLLNFNWLYWEWQNEQLTYKEVPSYLYNEIMAEKACYQALELDAAFKKAWALLVRIYYAQYNEIVSVEEAAKEKGLQLTEEELKSFTQEKPFAERAKKIAAAVGPEILFLALRASLSKKENRVEVTISILDAIGEVYKNRGDLPQMLLTSLLHKDKRVRYSASQAIVKINPVKPFSEARRVIETLQKAMGEWDSRVVLIVDNNDSSRNKLTEWITQMNMVAFAVPTGIEGLRKAQSFPPEDLIIVSTEIQDTATAYFVSTLGENFQSRDIPVLVFTPEAKKSAMTELYQKLAQVKNVFSTPFSEVEVKTLVKTTLEKSQSNYKEKSTKAVMKAAKALSLIQQGSILYPYLKESGEDLAKALSHKNNEIRSYVIKILGNLGEIKAIPALLELILNKEISASVRMTATDSLGLILSRTRSTLKAEDVQRIMQMISQEKDTSFQEKIFCLLGQANLGSDIKREIFSTQKLYKRIVVVEEKEKTKEKQVEKPEKEIKKPEIQEEKPPAEDDIWGEAIFDTEGNKAEEASEQSPSEELEEDTIEDNWGEE